MSDSNVVVTNSNKSFSALNQSTDWFGGDTWYEERPGATLFQNLSGFDSSFVMLILNKVNAYQQENLVVTRIKATLYNEHRNAWKGVGQLTLSWLKEHATPTRKSASG